MFKKLILFLSICAYGLFAQSGNTDDVEKTLQRFKNYRFGNVYVWKVRDASTIQEIIKSKKAAASGQADTKDFDAIKEKYDPGAVKIIQDGVNQEKLPSTISTEILNGGYDPIPTADLEVMYNFYLSQIRDDSGGKITTAFIITLPPPNPGEYPDEIIGMIVRETSFEDQTDDLVENLGEVTTEEVYSYRELKLEDIDTSAVKIGGNITTMYDLAMVYFQQDNVENVTLEARGLGNPDLIWIDQEKGVSEPLITYNSPYEVTDYDIQKFQRISNGEPVDYYTKNMEVLVSPDKISWKKYPRIYLRDRKGNIELDSMGNPMIDDLYPTNEELPELGLELAYGINSVNIPSFSSERLALNLIWRQLKFGLILPTGGWSSVAEDLYEQQRNLTYGGFGVNFAADFDIPVINRSDVFHISGGYVASDAEELDRLSGGYSALLDSYDAGVIDNAQFLFQSRNGTLNSHLVRANAALHYTFGMAIDKNNLLRFSLGGAVYNVETWNYNLSEIDEITSEPVFEQFDSETVGGITAKIDFMATNVRLPWGVSVNYFDESILSNVFVQFPVIENTMYLKLNAIGRVDIKSNPRAWEAGNETFFQPMLNLIYIF